MSKARTIPRQARKLPVVSLALGFLMLSALVFLLFAFVWPQTAYGQQFSSRGISSQGQAEVACISEIERLRVEVEALRARRDAIMDCNDAGQVYDGTGCQPIANNFTARWSPSAANPSSLSFYDGGTLVAGPITVTRGDDGSHSGCPPGMELE